MIVLTNCLKNTLQYNYRRPKTIFKALIKRYAPECIFKNKTF